MASPKLYAQIWRRPGHATFGKVIEDPGPITVSGTVPVNGVGEGRITLSKSYDRFDEILKPDVATPANAVSSLVRVFSESSATPIFEFLPKVFAGEQDKADPDVEISGPSIEAILGYAKVEAWDWTGIDDEQSLWPDWIYGGKNILGDLMEGCNPAITNIYMPASVTAGTFIIGVSFNGGAIEDTDPIAFNASAATVETRLEDNVNVGDVRVSGAGIPTDPWRIQTVTPCGEYVLSINSAGLTGGIAVQDRETIGSSIPEGWTTSFNPLNNLQHGQVDEFRLSTFVAPDPTAPACNTDGYAIFFDPGSGGFNFPGVQKIVPVKPGGRYYATITVRSTVNAPVRFVIRDLRENCIAANPSCDTSVTLTANTWTELTIPIVNIPTDVDRIIVRFATTDATTTASFYATCIEVREGMPPTTWGDIWEQLYADASTNHAGRRVWQIGATAADYLTLDFSNTVDSAGAVWADPEVNITLKRGQPYLRVAGECYKMGYEGRIVPNNVTTGTWKFQVYNPGTMGTNHSLISTGPSIQGGRDVTRRDLRRFLPPATDVAVEAGGQNIARSRNASAVTALGRIEQYVPNQDLGTLIEAATVADQTVDTNLQRSQSLSYVLTPSTLDPEPFIAYKAADTVYVLDPPDIATRTARRIKSLGFTFTKDKVEYPIQLESDSYVGVGPAIAAGVDFLLKEFKAIRERPPDATDILNYFPGLLRPGSLPPIVFAAVDTRPILKTYANYQCDGVDDQDTIRQAILDLDQNNEAFSATGTFGTFLFLDGTYTFDNYCSIDTVPFGKLRFVGDGLPRFVVSYNTSPAPLFNVAGGGANSGQQTLRFENIKFDGATLSNSKLIEFSTISIKPVIHISQCTLTNFRTNLIHSGSVASYMFYDNNVYACAFSDAAFHFDTATSRWQMIHDNLFDGCSGNMVSGFDFADHAYINDNINYGGTLTLNPLLGVIYANNQGF